MKHPAFRFRVRIAAAFAFVCVVTEVRSQEPGCRTGGVAAADAYVLSNPIYAYYFGGLEQYISSNKEHFQSGGDGIRCLSALSRVFLRQAFQLYDPTESARRDAINAKLAEVGISPGAPQSSPSTELYGASMRLARLARTLPAAANGDYEPYGTPTTELEQMQLMAEQVLRFYLQSSEMREIMSMMEPMIRELGLMEHKALQRQAAALGGSQLR